MVCHLAIRKSGYLVKTLTAVQSPTNPNTYNSASQHPFHNTQQPSVSGSNSKRMTHSDFSSSSDHVYKKQTNTIGPISCAQSQFRGQRFSSLVSIFLLKN